MHYIKGIDWLLYRIDLGPSELESDHIGRSVTIPTSMCINTDKCLL